jgi:hypothetical protein
MCEEAYAYPGVPLERKTEGKQTFEKFGPSFRPLVYKTGKKFDRFSPSAQIFVRPF